MWRDAPVGAGMTIQWQDLCAVLLLVFAEGVKNTPSLLVNLVVLKSYFLDLDGDLFRVGGTGPAVVQDPPELYPNT